MVNVHTTDGAQPGDYAEALAKVDRVDECSPPAKHSLNLFISELPRLRCDTTG